MTQVPGDGQPPYPEFERAPENFGDSQTPRESGPAPREVKIATVMLTVLAVILVFFGVLYISMASSLAAEMRAQVSTTMAEGMQITDAQLRNAVRVVGGLMILVGIGNALAAQGLRSRKKWSRPLGYTVCGVILAFSLFTFATGAISIPALVLALLALGAVLQLSKPALRSYLSGRPRNPR